MRRSWSSTASRRPGAEAGVRLRAGQIDDHLRKGLPSVWLISGDEPLQLMEAADAVRAAARAAGHEEREVLEAGPGFDWASLTATGSALSLFATRRIVELRMGASKPGKEGSKSLEGWAADPPPDTVLIVTCGKLDKREAEARWVKALEGSGVFVQVWPLGADEIEGWIARRMRSRGLAPEADAVRLLAGRVEGNLLAAAQEVDKLRLLHGEGRIGLEDILASVADSARYSVFDLGEAALGGDTERAVRILQGLRSEGETPVMVVWALAREMRMLAAASEGADPRTVFRGMPPKRQAAMAALVKRRSDRAWRRLLACCARTERVVKGQAPGRPWDELLGLVTTVSARGRMPA